MKWLRFMPDCLTGKSRKLYKTFSKIKLFIIQQGCATENGKIVTRLFKVMTITREQLHKDSSLSSEFFVSSIYNLSQEYF